MKHKTHVWVTRPMVINYGRISYEYAFVRLSKINIVWVKSIIISVIPNSTLVHIRYYHYIFIVLKNTLGWFKVGFLKQRTLGTREQATKEKWAVKKYRRKNKNKIWVKTPWSTRVLGCHCSTVDAGPTASSGRGYSWHLLASKRLLIHWGVMWVFPKRMKSQTWLTRAVTKAR